MAKLKIKTHKSTSKRLKISAKGLLKRRSAGLNHLKQKKSAGRKRSLRTSSTISGKLARNLKRALGGAK